MDTRTVLSSVGNMGSGAASTASTLLSNMSSPAAIALAGVGAVTLLALEVKHQINEHRDAEHLKQIEEILRDYNTFLVKIPIPGYAEQPTLPPPFIIDKKDKALSATSLLINIQILESMLDDSSIKNDAFLDQYSMCIRKAKARILEFYKDRFERSFLFRGAEGDITSSVLTYFLLLLNDHFKNFAGFETDIAMLKRLRAMINSFACLGTGDPRNRQRNERLAPACKALDEAVKILEDNSLSRRLSYNINELRSIFNSDYVPKLLKLLATFTLEESAWKYVALSDLQDGVVRPKYEHDHTILSKNEIKIDAPVFGVWVKRISANYYATVEQKSVDPLIQLTDKDLAEIKKSNFFAKCQNFLTLKSPQPQANGEVSKDQTQYIPVGYDKECRVLISSAITDKIKEPGAFLLIKKEQAWELYEVDEDRKCSKLKLEEVEKLSEFLPKEKITDEIRVGLGKINKALTAYRNDKQLKTRSAIYLELARFVELSLDFRRYCQKLTKFTSGVGDFYMDLPNVCNFIFDSLRAFSKNFDNQSVALSNDMAQIKKEQRPGNSMLITPQQKVVDDLEDLLTAIQVRTSKIITSIMNKHHSHNRVRGNPRATKVIDVTEFEDPMYKDKRKDAIKEMVLLTNELNDKYNNNVDYEISHQRSVGELKDDSISEEKRAPGVLTSARVMLSSGSSSVSANSSSSAAAQPASSSSNSSSTAAALPPILSVPAKLEDVLININKKINEITFEEKLDPKTTSAYKKLFTALDELDLKWKTMEKENKPERQVKARAIKDLTYKLCNDTYNFLMVDPQNRKEEAIKFSQKLKNELSTPGNNKFLDEHKDTVWKILAAVKELALCLCLGVGFYRAYQRGGFFRTSSRVASYQVEEAGSNIANKLGAEF